MSFRLRAPDHCSTSRESCSSDTIACAWIRHSCAVDGSSASMACCARTRSSVNRSYSATIMRAGDIVSIELLTYAARSIVRFIGNPFPRGLVIRASSLLGVGAVRERGDLTSEKLALRLQGGDRRLEHRELRPQPGFVRGDPQFHRRDLVVDELDARFEVVLGGR